MLCRPSPLCVLYSLERWCPDRPSENAENENLRCSMQLYTTCLASWKLGLILSNLILRSQVLVKLQLRKMVY